MTNLYQETTDVLAQHEKTWADVKMLVLDKYSCDPSFASIALDTDYDAGYGIEMINLDFMVVGEDFWLERHEYDGSEWWEYKAMPTLPENFTTLPDEFKTLIRSR